VTDASAVDIYRILLEAKQRAFNEPEWFLRNILHQDPDPWQISGIEALADVHRFLKGNPTVVNHEGLNRITVRSCHGPGKTHWLAQIMHWATFCFYVKVVCTAPKEKQLKTRLWPRFRKILRDADPHYKDLFTVNATDITIGKDEDWGCVAETASDPENMAGYHDEPQFFLVDEASARVLDPMFPVIEGALTTPGSTLVTIGNPTRMEGEFWAAHNKANVKKLYFQMHIKPEDSRFVDHKWTENMRSKYGANSPVFMVRALGEFAAFDEALLVHPEYVDDMLGAECVPDGSYPILKVSVDVADGGADATIITVAEHYQSRIIVKRQLHFYFPAKESPILAGKKAIELFDVYHGNPKNGDVIIPDANGVGAGTAGYIMDQKYPCIPFVGGERANDPVRFRNKRTECSILTAEKIIDGSLVVEDGAIDDEEEFRAHVLSIKRNLASEKLDDIEPKEKIRKAGLPSPDRWDSLMMQMIGKSSNIMDVYYEPEVVGRLESETYGGLI